ncbi:hypothetical protein, partial [Arcanobacterium phocae]|uniref:hypothetical protein n=1 Tax=Arcanobacterium phocae TaxID=131112 RepID=UPI001C0E996B
MKQLPANKSLGAYYQLIRKTLLLYNRQKLEGCNEKQKMRLKMFSSSNTNIIAYRAPSFNHSATS